MADGHTLQNVVYTLFTFGSLDAEIGQWQLHVLEYVQFVYQVEALEDEAQIAVAQVGTVVFLPLGHFLPHEPQFARGGIIQQAYDVEQRGLATARRAHDGYKLARMYLQVHFVQCGCLHTFGAEYFGKINGFVQEMMAGQKVEKVFNHEQKNFEKFCEMNESFRKESTNALAFAGMMIPTIVSLSYLNYAISACVGGLFTLKGLMDLGSLSSYLIYVRQSAMPLNQFTQQVNFLLSALSGAERIFDMMDEKPEIDEGSVTLCNAVKNADGSLTECSQYTGVFAWKVPAELNTYWNSDSYKEKVKSQPIDKNMDKAAANDGTYLVELRGDVRFKNVVFGYVPGKTILNDVTLYAKPGQKIAFVGSTGAGKTTIINLINRFYDIQSGTITYDGIDIKDIKKDDLRKSLAMVIQDTHLFTGTIADNIRYGKLDATDEEVRNASLIANADSFIRRLPDGYNTMLYSDGSNLSQGQRQLLAIARAAIAKAPVLILDEATSSVDTRTEGLIEKGMDAIMEGRTVFVIAHRLSTVRNSKAIMVLEKGQIIERGSHDELLEQKGRYYQLYTGQFELS